MTRFHNISGNRVQFTEAEEIARDAEEAQAVIDTQAKQEAETARLEKKASGKQKLKDLGLDDDEIKVLTGA
tara:strand:+ start:272 stop:484 length:213 start_codon:yes stop_codon:yes gene_type:complete